MNETAPEERSIPVSDLRPGNMLLYDREERRLWLPIREVIFIGGDSLLLTLELPLSYLEGLDEFTLPTEEAITIRSVLPATHTLILWQIEPDMKRIVTIHARGKEEDE